MHEELFNVGDLRKVRNLEKSNKPVPNTLNKKMLYIGGRERCYKVTEVFAGDVSGQSTTFFLFIDPEVVLNLAFLSIFQD